MRITLFKVYEDIEFKENIFKGLGRFLMDDWDWFTMYTMNGENVVEDDIFDDEPEKFDLYNINKELSQSLKFYRLRLSRYLESNSSITKLFDIKKAQEIRITTTTAQVVEEDIIIEEEEFLLVRYLYHDHTSDELDDAMVATTKDEFINVKENILKNTSYDFEKLEEVIKDLDKFILIAE